MVILRGWNGFAYPSVEASYSDLTLTHYTNLAFLREQLLGNGSLPLWAPTILSGYPFIANPLNGIWYLFGWPALVLPLPFAFNLLVGLHLAWGALGMYLLLRSQGVSLYAAIFGGLAFALLPKIYAHYGAGHLTLMYAIPWTPWLLLVTKDNFKERRWLSLLLPGLILGLIFLADVRWAVYAGALWLGWTVYKTWQSFRISETKSWQPILHSTSYLLAQILIAALLTAILWLPMLEYTNLSIRITMQPEDMFETSLRLRDTLGLFYPPLSNAEHETTLYPGAVVLLLSLLALLLLRRDNRSRFWVAIAIIFLLFSFGANLPFSSLIAKLPIVNLLRVPPRSLFLVGMAQVALGALVLDRWDLISQPKYRRLARLLLVGLLAFSILIGILVLDFVGAEKTGPFLWGGIAIILAALLLLFALNTRIPSKLFFLALFTLLLVDSGLSGQTMLAYRSEQSVFNEKSELAVYLSAQDGRFRTYSPSFSFLQHLAYVAGIEEVDGVDPLYLQSYANYMQSATNIPWEGYSVTVPPTAQGIEGNSIYPPDPDKLGELNVRYLLADYALPPVEGLELVEIIEGTWIYQNLVEQPRARVLAETINEPTISSPVEIKQLEPNQITVQAEGPGRLVLSEILYPGWEARVEDQAVPIEAYAEILRSVQIPDGKHLVVFNYRPRSFFIGAAISVLAWLAILGLGIAGLVQWKKTSSLN